MRNFIIAFLIIISLSAHLFSQTDPKLQVIVMFNSGIVNLPLGKTISGIGELQTTNSEVRKTLTGHKAVYVSKAFPHFSTADTVATSRTGERVHLADLSNTFLVEFSDTSNVASFISAVSKLSGVVYAEPNFNNYQGHGFPNDAHYENGDQWGLNNYGQSGGTSDADIDGPDAWQITTGSNILIGVIDDGVDAAHEELTGKVGGDAGVYGGDPNWAFGHGTHVSGIIAGTGNNTVGVAGVNWAGLINSQRIENGSNQDFYDGIMASVNAGSKILNNS